MNRNFSEEQLEKARTLNVYYSHTYPNWQSAVEIMYRQEREAKGGVGAIGPLYSVDSGIFVSLVYAWQHRRGMNADGVFGPISVAKALNYKDTEPLVCVGGKANTFMYHGKAVSVDLGEREAFVINHCKPRSDGKAMSFVDHPGCYGVRRDCIDIGQVVLHWDVCASSAQCYQTLLQRGLSIHFTVDADGTVNQHLDLALMAYHAKNANPYTVGVEINNPFFIQRFPCEKGRPVVKEQMPNGNGLQSHLGFTVEQVESVVALCDALCSLLHLPKRIPDVDDVVCLSPETESARHWQGVCGHYHSDRNKIDPGSQLWPFLLKEGFVRSKTS